MIVRTQPAIFPSHSARVAEVMALSDLAFRKRYRSSYETPSPSSTLHVQKRYRERISAFRQPTLATWVDPEDGRVHTNILTYAPPLTPVQTSPSPEWSPGSLPVSPSSPLVPSPIVSPVTTPIATISVDEDQLLERENHDLRMQVAKERYEQLELADRVARMERRHESREE
nr:hypothetical protein [Tanacetum cinerariifolium]